MRRDPSDLIKPLEVLRLYRQHDYTLADALDSRAAAGSDRELVVHDGGVMSWARFQVRSERLAWALHARGVRKGDRVAIIARNDIAHLLLLAAVSRLSAIMAPFNPDYGAAEVGYVLEHAAPRLVFVQSATRAAADEARVTGGLEFETVLLDDGGIDALIDGARPVDLPPASADDTCLLIYTSGTSGYPKGVMHSQRNFLLAGEANVQRMYLQPDDRVMIILPLFHINALFYSLSGTLAAGCTVILTPKFSASNFWRIAAETGATVINVIEAMGVILATRPRSEYRAGHRIRAAYGVRAASAPTFRDDFDIHNIVSGFGMSECPGVLAPPFEGPDKVGSMGVIGRHPDPDRPWAQCRVLDDEGADVAEGVTGELAIRSPILMKGYYRDEAETERAFRDGWFLTGDLVRRDADGFYFFVSRKKDIIRRRGENIAGAELDRVIGQHPAVHEAAAIPVPSELGEDEILVAVAIKPGAVVTAQEIAAWCRERLSAAKTPRYVVFVDELPHTATHKVAKMVLRADAGLRDRATDLSAA